MVDLYGHTCICILYECSFLYFLFFSSARLWIFSERNRSLLLLTCLLFSISLSSIFLPLFKFIFPLSFSFSFFFFSFDFVKLEPTHAEDFIEYLIEHESFDEAAVQLTRIINDDNFSSSRNKSKHQLWNDLCEVVSRNPVAVRSLILFVPMRLLVFYYVIQGLFLLNIFYVCVSYEKLEDY